MKILTIVGKVDTRSLAYPLARALSITGLTAIITDDGAYRRLFKGKDMIGNVSGVDIRVNPILDDEIKNSMNKTGVPYDYLLVVSADYIPSNTDGLIICHGVDNTMTQLIEEPKPEVVEQKPKKDKKAKKGAEEVAQENTEQTSVSLEKTEEIVEEPKEDVFVYPDNIPVNEIFISYNKPLDKYATGILLKEFFMNYIYSCEETQELQRITDKAINKLIANIATKPLDIEVKELEAMLARLEYTNDRTKKKVK